tara:strand:+ start:3304 stop:3498 length:195 start_codon:yes stop_codon:yes gene_type:complete
MIKTSLNKPYDENSKKEIQNFREELKRLKDEVINFQPPKPTRQTRAKIKSQVYKNISGWRRGFF